MRRLSRIGNTISKQIGKAIGDYNMIVDGDRILVAVSGGKDSLTLLSMLAERRKWAPVSYELIAAHIKTDFACASCVHERTLEKFFTDTGVRYVFDKVNVLEDDGTTSCFWCSWNKRKALFETAERLGCRKIAFGHHKDDIIETTLLNLFFKGEISTMNPYQEMFKGEIVLIRPLCFTEEAALRQFAEESAFPSKLCKCPFGNVSNRKYIKEFIGGLEKRSPDVKTNIFRSISRIKRDYIDLKEPAARSLC
ncbi:MAG: ATP-binding protein [Candidatus Omnitrophota bacterium]